MHVLIIDMLLHRRREAESELYDFRIRLESTKKTFDWEKSHVEYLEGLIKAIDETVPTIQMPTYEVQPESTQEGAIR